MSLFLAWTIVLTFLSGGFAFAFGARSLNSNSECDTWVFGEGATLSTACSDMRHLDSRARSRAKKNGSHSGFYCFLSCVGRGGPRGKAGNLDHLLISDRVAYHLRLFTTGWSPDFRTKK